MNNRVGHGPEEEMLIPEVLGVVQSQECRPVQMYSNLLDLCIIV